MTWQQRSLVYATLSGEQLMSLEATLRAKLVTETARLERQSYARQLAEVLVELTLREYDAD